MSIYKAKGEKYIKKESSWKCMDEEEDERFCTYVIISI